MSNPLDEVIEQLNKLKQYDGYTLSEAYRTGSAGMRITNLKDRLGKNTAEAMAAHNIEQINSGVAPKMSDEEVENVVDKMVDQILSKVFA